MRRKCEWQRKLEQAAAKHSHELAERGEQYVTGFMKDKVGQMKDGLGR